METSLKDNKAHPPAPSECRPSLKSHHTMTEIAAKFRTTTLNSVILTTNGRKDLRHG